MNQSDRTLYITIVVACLIVFGAILGADIWHRHAGLFITDTVSSNGDHSMPTPARQVTAAAIEKEQTARIDRAQADHKPGEPYKCGGRGNKVTYQDAPCGPDQVTMIMDDVAVNDMSLAPKVAADPPQQPVQQVAHVESIHMDDVECNRLRESWRRNIREWGSDRFTGYEKRQIASILQKIEGTDCVMPR